jgi:hypothetical protein
MPYREKKNCFKFGFLQISYENLSISYGTMFCAPVQIYTFVCKIHNLTEYVFVKPRVNFVNWDGKSINHTMENSNLL